MKRKSDINVYEYKLNSAAIDELRALMIVLDEAAMAGGLVVSVPEMNEELQLSAGVTELLLQFVGTTYVKDGSTILIADEERELPVNAVESLIGRPQDPRSTSELLSTALGQPMPEGSRVFKAKVKDFVALLRKVGGPIE